MKSRISQASFTFLLASCAAQIESVDKRASLEARIDPRVVAEVTTFGEAHVLIELDSGVAWEPAAEAGALTELAGLPAWRAPVVAASLASLNFGATANATLTTFASMPFETGPFPFVAATIDGADLAMLRNSKAVLSVRVHDELETLESRTASAPALPLSATTRLIGASKCWDQGLEGRGSVVVVIDTGVDDTRETFRDENGRSRVLWSGRVIGAGKGAPDIEFGRGGSYDHPLPAGWEGHGTRVAAVIAGNARELDDEDTRGVAPEASIVSLRVTNRQGKAATYDVALALAYVAFVLAPDFEIAAVNLSLARHPQGKPLPVSPCDRDNRMLWAAVQLVRSRGIPVVTGTGNLGRPERPGILFPACLSNTITVAGSSMDKRWTHSNWGPGVHFFAPAFPIVIRIGKDRVKYVEGTSYSAAHMSGCLALLHECQRVAGPGQMGAVARLLLSKPRIDGRPRIDVWQAALGMGCVTRPPSDE